MTRGTPGGSHHTRPPGPSRVPALAALAATRQEAQIRADQAPAIPGRGAGAGARQRQPGLARLWQAAAASACLTLTLAAVAAPASAATASARHTAVARSSVRGTRATATRAGGGRTVGGPQLAGRGVVVNYPSRTSPRLPYVDASSYLVADAGTGEVLAGKDPHGWYPPASTLKVLTAITLMPVLNPHQVVVASSRAADIEPSKVGLVARQKYTVAALFRALLLISANDAAIALAQATGSYARGVAMMNAEARHLRADDTVAKRPNGLDAPGQHTSAYDLALFARQALAIPALMKDESLRSTRFEQWPHHWEKLYNQNTMLATYPGDIFGKIGWTTPDKTTFIGIARRHGTTLIVTIMHCKPLTEMTYATRLLNWGFAMDGKVAPIGTLVSPLPTVTATHPAPARRPRPTATPAAASPGPPALPLTVGAAALVLASLAGVIALLASRRGRRRRSRHAR